MQVLSNLTRRGGTNGNPESYKVILSDLRSRAKDIYSQCSCAQHERAVIFEPLLELLSRAVQEKNVEDCDPDACAIKAFLSHLTVSALTADWVLRDERVWALLGEVLEHFQGTQSYYVIAPNIHDAMLLAVESFGEAVFRGSENAGISERKDFESERPLNRFINALVRERRNRERAHAAWSKETPSGVLETT